MSSLSPYTGLGVDKWSAKTTELLGAHPLTKDQLRKAVITAWDDIFKSNIGGLQIGQDILPQPQVMGFFLHELVPMIVGKSVAGWRRGAPPGEKDLHYDSDPSKSIEIKTSSSPSGIFGNRSYGQPATGKSRPKDGYYLAVNFEPFSAEAKAAVANKLQGGAAVPQSVLPRIVKIRFGWLEHTDWRAQKSATGQQASLSRAVLRYKLIEI